MLLFLYSKVRRISAVTVLQMGAYVDRVLIYTHMLASACCSPIASLHGSSAGQLPVVIPLVEGST